MLQRAIIILLGRLAQSVMCLTADPGVASSLPAWSYTFMETVHEIISSAILLPFADSRSYKRKCYKRKYVHKVLVINNLLVKLAQEKSMVR